ncbi:alpha/beta fold hydrolase [Acuticoccus kandeliae]|uniref:alpha/beta fold hydrolase n=1 Tax=Acuticoccus kandeliae TaxID=2073160 RepID=UPI0013005081|nr:alpha/beta hydrolase [Acuticoccus kandeliae]
MRILALVLTLAAAFAAGDAANAAPQGKFVTGGGGLKIYTRAWGNPNGPAILLVHGWAQSSESWSQQMGGSLARKYNIVAMDMRGHGKSEAPADKRLYQSGDLMADDVAAVIRAYRLRRPVLVAWSYGGVVVGDYLAKYGDGNVAGVVTVGAIIGLGTPELSTLSRASTMATLGAALRLPFNSKLKGVVPRFFGTPGHVRRAFIGRKVDHSDTYKSLTKPLLVIHGANDAIVSPDVADYFKVVQPRAKVLIFDKSGHFPFAEEPERFNAELSAFVDRVN